MKANGPMKALRLGVIYSGRLLEEKLVRTAETVRVGSEARNTIVLPLGDKAIPKHFNLFPYDTKSNKYSLRVTPGAMKGTITIGGETRQIDDAIKDATSSKVGNDVIIPVPYDSRGKVSIGDSILLFNFVTAPPAIAKPRLPASMRGGWVRSIDWPFVTLFIVMFIIESVFFGMAASQASLKPKNITAENLLKDKFIRQALKIEEPEPEPEVKEVPTEGEGEGVAKKEEDANAGKSSEPKTAEEVKAAKIEQATKKLAAAADRAQKLVDLAMGDATTAVFKAIAASADAGSASDMIVQVASDDGGGDSLTAANLAKVTKVESKDGGGGKKVDLAVVGGGTKKMGGDIEAKGGNLTKVAGATAVKRTPKIQLGTATTTGSGYLSQKTIMDGLRAQVQPKVKKCYEVALAKEEIRGTITVMFVIDTNGKVKKAEIVDGKTTISNTMLQMCVKMAVKSMSFNEKPQGGEVTIPAYPFNLSSD